ncbi:MAG TPA: ATP-binding cassette domain-containing protein [Rhizomicrobium sp.]
MTIRLADIHVAGSFAEARRPLFADLHLEIPDGARVGVLGAPKSGKTTLLRLMCGTMAADRGFVERTSRVSWPIPLATFLVPASTVAQNIRFVARLYGVAGDEFPRSTAKMAALAEFLNTPLKKCPKFVKPRLALALGIGLDFDIYLFDGSFAPADKEFKEQAAQIVAERMQGRGFVLATGAAAEVEKNCDSVYILESGQVKYFADAKEGVEYFKQLLAAEKEKQAAAVEKGAADAGEGEDEGLGDIDMLGAAIADEL